MRVPKSSINLAADLSSLVVNGATILGTFVAIGGTSASVINSNIAFDISFDGANLPVRLAIFVVVAAALGWGLGLAVGRFSTAKTEGMTLICHVAAVFWAGLLVGTADWIAPGNTAGGFPERHLLTLIGLATIFQLTMFQFRNTGVAMPSAVMRIRCEALLVLSVATGFILILTEAGVA